MKFTRKLYAKRNSRNKRQHKSRRQSKYRSKHRFKHRSKRHSKRQSKYRSKQKGGSNGLVQLGYNTTRGMTSTIKNFINTYMGNTPSASPQATKNQYSKHI